jgi:dihydromethanopterin reductase
LKEIVMDVRAMCAIGLRGQLGLKGRLPWQGASERVYRADVERFWQLTEGHVLLVGPTTMASIPKFAFAERTFALVRSSEAPAEVLARYPGRVVYVGGGPAMWAAYAPLIGHWDITRLPYDGPADRHLDPAWLTQGAPGHD